MKKVFTLVSYLRKICRDKLLISLSISKKNKFKNKLQLSRYAMITCKFQVVVVMYKISKMKIFQSSDKNVLIVDDFSSFHTFNKIRKCLLLVDLCKNIFRVIPTLSSIFYTGSIATKWQWLVHHQVENQFF